jgi:glycosyltransferase involved in cell wall biosynthesis
VSAVDVVVPCYNYGRYLKGCVESILTQRGVDVRVLIIDDVSPDNTPAIAKEISAADPRVSYVRNEVNLGLIGTANKGIMDWVTADYVVLLSADDKLTPGSLARATKLMDARPEVGLTYGMALMMHDDGVELVTGDPRDPEFAVVPGWLFLRRMFDYGNAVPSPCAVMRTSVQHRIGGYDPQFRHTSDVDMWMRAAAVGPVGVVNAIQGLYRWHNTNMSAAYQLRPIGDRAEVLATCHRFVKFHGDDFPNSREWLKQMKHRFGNEAMLIAGHCSMLPGNYNWQDILKFAKACRSGYWASSSWWRFLSARFVGRPAAVAFRRLKDMVGWNLKSDPTHANGAWYDHGVQIGWWPEDSRQCRRWGRSKRRGKVANWRSIEEGGNVIKDFIRNTIKSFGYEIHKSGSSAVLERYDPSYLSRLGQPRMVFDVGVSSGTPSLYRAFPDAYSVLVRFRSESNDAITSILENHKGEAHYKVVESLEPPLQIGRARQKKNAQPATLDSIFQSLDSQQGPVLLKIDAEGNELEVLQGATKLLQSTEFVIAEASVSRSLKSGYRFEELINWMNSHGFHVFSFLHVEHEESEARPRFVDIVFKRSSSIDVPASAATAECEVV